VRGIFAPFAGTALMTLPVLGLRGVFLVGALFILASWLMGRTVTLDQATRA